MMGLSGFFGKKDLSYKAFEKWVDATLSADLPEGIEAFCFNLYDDGKGQWSAEIIGAASFDPGNSDWACDEVFDNREHPLKWSSTPPCSAASRALAWALSMVISSFYSVFILNLGRN